MNLPVNEMKLPARLAVYLRLSKDEYIRVMKDAAVSGRKVQDLVKDAYFQHLAPVPALLSKDDHHALMTALGRIGKNINQIAKHFNSGGKCKEISELETIQHRLGQIGEFFSSKHCLCQKMERLS